MLIEPVIIFSRLIIADCNLLGGACISCKTPSMRKRTRNFLSSGADKLEVPLEKEIETVNRIDIERVTDREDEAVCAEPDRDDLESVRVFRADLRDNVWRNDHG